MVLNSVQEIERAIDELTPEQLEELYAWLDRHRSGHNSRSGARVVEQGLGLFGSTEDAALLDEVVRLAYEERRRPSGPAAVL